MTNDTKREDEGGLVVLEGELTLTRAEELKGRFLRALAGAGTVTVRFGEVSDADLSFMQLLCSLCRSAARERKKVSFGNGLPRVLLEAATTAGFTRLKGCMQGDEQHCLWAAGAGAFHA